MQRGNHDSDTQLIALRSSDGTTSWSSPHGAQWESYMAPAVSSLGAFINGGTYGGMYGFNATSGSQLFFNSQLPQTDRWKPSLLGDEFFSFVDGTFRGHSTTSGAALWSLSLGWSSGSMNRITALRGRSAYLINNSPTAAYNDEDLVCVSLDTRQPVWSVNGEFTGTPAVDQFTVYALSGNTIQARSTTDGSLLATFVAPPGQTLFSQPIITDELLFAASANNTFVFDLKNQTLLQSIARGGSIVVAEDQLIIADGSGTVAAYGPPPELTFSPIGGIFTQPADITLTAAEPGSIIHYTLNGNAPDLESPSLSPGQSVRLHSSRSIRAITVKGSAVSRIYQASFTVTAPIDTWRLTHFGSPANSGSGADFFDFDHDGSVNLLEFASGTNPTTSSVASLRYTGSLSGGGTLDAVGQPTVVVEESEDGPLYHALFIRRTDYLTSGLSYIPYFTPDLLHWAEDSNPPVVLTDNGIHQVVRVPFPPLVNGVKPKFFRLGVSIAP